MRKRYLTAFGITVLYLSWRWIITPPPGFTEFLFAFLIAFTLAMAASIVIWWIIDRLWKV